MCDGVVQQVDTPENLYNFPNNQFVAGFIGSPQMNFIDATLHKDGSGMKMDIGGTTMTLPEKKAKVLIEKGYDGKEVVFGLRPEHIFDRALYVGEVGDNTIKATVRVYELLGAEVCLYFDYAGVQLTTRGNPKTQLRAESEGTFVFDLDECHFFDKETGEVITN
jgi:multiple sugar transport system ATP-binding protein